MGNEQSREQNRNLQGTMVYDTDMWILKEGVQTDGTFVSIFELKQENENKDDLEKLAKYLRTLRHPCIVKHSNSYTKNNRFYLTTEHVTPLEVLLSEDKLSIVEKIAGIYNILQALAFIHSKCLLSHKNVCTSSVFVCADGNWKLAGFEKMQSDNKAVVEDSVHHQDVYAFGQFALHLLSDQNEISKIAGGLEFITRIQNECLNPTKRPSCLELKNDLIFKNDFLDIRLFLQNLVLKSDIEKQEFFSSLLPRLKKLDRSLIAHHLSTLLLCRFVFMDSTAVEYLLPHILKPQKDGDEGLFEAEIFQSYIIPQLLRIFCVRSRHIRLVLFNSFSYYVDLFSKDELTTIILPQVLIGIRDTDDQVVAKTLEALAKLVSILGAQVVVGGCRQKLFNEAFPNKYNNKNDEKISSNHEPRRKEAKETLNETLNQDSDRILERSSPDGLESMDEQDWSDWDNESSTKSIFKSSNNVTKKQIVTGLGEEFDIMAIEIAKSVSIPQNDFFSDMEPKIEINKHQLTTKNSLDMIDTSLEEGSGWNDTDLYIEL